MEPSDRIVTIDGPAGAGKSTLARRLAAELNWTYLDTGAMYRAVAVAVRDAGLSALNEEDVAPVVRGLDLQVRPDAERTAVLLGGVDITARIREPQISGLASVVSALKPVREAMLDLQRKIGAGGDLVAEGRDMGTVVFPHAGLKIFLKASLQERSRRRHAELLDMGGDITRDEVERDMASRDEADRTRALAPLRPARDSVVIDSTDLTVEVVLERMVILSKRHFFYFP